MMAGARQLDNSEKQQDVQLMDFIKEYLVSPGEWDQLQSLMPEEPVLPGRWEGSRHINNIPNPKFQERQELNAQILERILEACGPDGEWILEGRSGGLGYKEIDHRDLRDATLETRTRSLKIRQIGITGLHFKPMPIRTKIDKIVVALKEVAPLLDPNFNTQDDLFGKVDRILGIKTPVKSRTMLLEKAGLLEFSAGGRKTSRDKRDHGFN